MVPFQADQGKGHQSSGARDFLAGRSPLRGGGYPLSGIFPLLGFLNTSLNGSEKIVTQNHVHL